MIFVHDIFHGMFGDRPRRADPLQDCPCCGRTVEVIDVEFTIVEDAEPEEPVTPEARSRNQMLNIMAQNPVTRAMVGAGFTRIGYAFDADNQEFFRDITPETIVWAKDASGQRQMRFVEENGIVITFDMVAAHPADMIEVWCSTNGVKFETYDADTVHLGKITPRDTHEAFWTKMRWYER